jgi:hypothetical protein
MIGDIIEIERAKRTTFETLETKSSQRLRDSADAVVVANEDDGAHVNFAALMASVRDKLGQFKIRLD